jgi:hypothetical protein
VNTRSFIPAFGLEQMFGLLWPAMFATRMMPVGLLLLVTELVIFVEARRKNAAKNPH